MDLDECLAELREGLLRDASTQVSGDPDFFWSTPTLIRYINDAQRRFARRALCIRDATTDVCKVTLVSGSNLYILDKSILRVTSARHEDASQDLVRMTHPQTFARINPFTDSVASGELSTFDVNSSLQPGQPVEFSTDEGIQVDDAHQIQMLVRPTPDTAQVGKIINMRVIRLPLYRLDLEDADDNTPTEEVAESVATGISQTLEIPEDWHLDMLEWAAYRAWRTYDGREEGGVDAMKRAETHRDRFEKAIKECLAEIADKVYQPPTWSFGQGAFARYVK